MWKKLIAAACALALGACASASEEAATPQPALFVVRDADSTMYLYGTVHVRQAGQAWGGANAQAALAEADEVWTEMEISPEADAEVQRMMMQYGIAPADRPLSSWLNEEERARLDALGARLGLPAVALERFRPWLAAVTLSLMPMMQAGFDPNLGVDRAIDAIGDETGKTMRAFETPEEQLRFLAGLSDEAQHEMLLDAIAETEAGPEQLMALSEAWERGDLHLIEQLVVIDMQREYPELYERLFSQRNAAWTETLTQEMAGAGVDFVAVGAGHLVGEDGLVARMRARGFEVERVR